MLRRPTMMTMMKQYPGAKYRTEAEPALRQALESKGVMQCRRLLPFVDPKNDRNKTINYCTDEYFDFRSLHK